MKVGIALKLFTVICFCALMISMCTAGEEFRNGFTPIRKCNWTLCKRPVTRHRGGVFGPYRNRPRCCFEYDREREREENTKNIRHTVSEQ